MLIVAPGAARHAGWLHAKLTLVALPDRLSRLVLSPDGRICARDAIDTRTRWYRVFNEAPALLLIAIVLLAVVKPF